VPSGLQLVADERDLKPGAPPDHYFLAPAFDIPLEEYVGLLLSLAPKFERIRKI
jgi:hypothetical protein